MSWFWMVFFLVLSAVAVGTPFLLRPRPAAETESGADESRVLRRRLESSLRELDLDLAAGKITAGDHEAGAAEIAAQLEALDRPVPLVVPDPILPPVLPPPPGGAGL